MKKRKFYGSYHLKSTRAWKLCSEYIRRASNGSCFTCGAKKDWRELDCGHYWAGSICGKDLFFNPLNLAAQCTGCNRFKHGNIQSFSLALQKKHGIEILEKLEAIRSEERKKGVICRYSPEELKEIENLYTTRLEQLEKV